MIALDLFDERSIHEVTDPAERSGADATLLTVGVIDCLAQITRNKVAVNSAEFYPNSTPTSEQEE